MQLNLSEAAKNVEAHLACDADARATGLLGKRQRRPDETLPWAPMVLILLIGLPGYPSTRLA